LCIFDAVTGYKRTPFGRFLNSRKYKILRTYRNKHLNIKSKRNKHFIKFIIHKEVLILQNCEIALLGLHFLRKFFILPRLPSNEKNSVDHHNSYNKGQIFPVMAYWKTL
jgi:hypothetical protein